MTHRTRLAVLATLLSPSPALATVMVDMPLPALADDADVAVSGTVVKTGVRAVLRNGVLEPVTITLVQVSEWLKGASTDAPTTVEIRTEGGKLRDVETVVHGAPTFGQGEEIVVFLRREADAFRVSQMAQSKFRVVRRKDEAPLALRDLDDVTFVRWKNDGQLRFLPTGSTPAVFPLDEVLGAARRSRKSPARDEAIKAKAGAQ